MLAEGVLKVKFLLLKYYIKIFGIGCSTFNMVWDFQCKLLCDGCLHSEFQKSIEDL